MTATPKHSLTVSKPGMNLPEVYGNVICQVPAPELVNQGYILPPQSCHQATSDGARQADDI